MYRLLRRVLNTEPSENLCKKAITIVVKARAANTVTFPDSLPTVRILKRKRISVAAISNVSSHQVALEIMRHAGLLQYFKAVITSASTGIRKPDPGIFRSAAAELNVEPRNAVIVGDSEHHDIQGGLISGWHTVLIDRKGTAKNSQADYCFATLEEALPTLQSL